MVLQLALQQAFTDSRYAVWVQRLGIRDVQDFHNLLNGSGESGNLQTLVFRIELSYVTSNSKYSQYVPLIQLAMTMLGVDIGFGCGIGGGTGGGSDDDIIDLSAYSGMTVGESRAIRATR